MALWSTLEFALEGPSSVAGGDPNPFLVEATISFRSPSGRRLEVPTFFDGDGRGGPRGRVWRVRFTPDETGVWQLQSTADEPTLNGYQGSFSVRAPSSNAPMPQRCGRLQAADGWYLQFADGSSWLKGGINEPEDFLALGVLGRSWAAKKRTVNRLARLGVNSMYLMLQNVDGDGDNVWPWLERKSSRRFDVAKLGRWDHLFRHMQARGVVLHLVLEDDSGWTGFDRHLYYREMVARFGHHNALIWNLSEEYDENYRPGQIRRFAAQLEALDPYDHPITVHHAGPTSRWEPFLRDLSFDMTSFQTGNAPQNDLAVSWRDRAVRARRPLVISFDETGETDASEAELARRIVWSVYLGGASFELYTGAIRRIGDFAEHLRSIRRARSLLAGLPFWEMDPCNHLLARRTGEAYCLGLAGQAYVLYAEGPEPVTLDLADATGSFSLTWHDPRSSAGRDGGAVAAGDERTLGPPPFLPGSAAILRRGAATSSETDGGAGPTCFGVPSASAGRSSEPRVEGP